MYQIPRLATLGKGSFAKVVQVIHKHDKSGKKKEYFAAKVLTKTNDQYERHSFQKEAALLFELDHRNIIQYKDFYQNDDQVVIVTEKMQMNLIEAFNSPKIAGNLTLSAKLKIFKKIVKAVVHCHE